MNWYEANKTYLMASIRLVKKEISGYTDEQSSGEVDPEIAQLEQEMENLRSEMNQSPTLEMLSEIFGLTSFERKVLLLCAGVELDSAFRFSRSAEHEKGDFLNPNFAMALTAFKDAHWSSLSPERPLRYWQLIELADKSQLTKSPLFINERILHFLTGIEHTDESLIGLLEPVTNEKDLVSSHLSISDEIVKTISLSVSKSELPLLLIKGDEISDKTALISHICRGLNQRLYRLRASLIPENPKELDNLVKIWNRESALSSAALLLDCNEVDKTNTAQLQSIHIFCEKLSGLTFISGRKWMPNPNRQLLIYEVAKPSNEEQFSLWKNLLNSHADGLGKSLENVVTQFSLSADAIEKASQEVTLMMDSSSEKNQQSDLVNSIKQVCCRQSRPELEELAQRIDPLATWDDLILPETQKNILREIAMHVRQRNKVYNDWGFAAKVSRGLGISALFTGDSGTGKTMASEVLANELNLDLYRIDLSQVVNKYIGETEKNIKKIFDAADSGGAILLFDEADALFGKRSEVKDSHDRFANIEVSYLLQRMEAYRGLAVLTTNLKTSLDKAFLRRIRFIVQFPFPDSEQRKEIWKRVFPEKTPTDNLDMYKLSKLNITGGNIRNIAMNAAFIAADCNEPVQMEHIRRAAKTEYAKLEKPMSTSESGTW